MTTSDTTLRNVSDAILGTVAVTSPVWFGNVQMGFAILMMIGGGVLMAVRLMIAIREWRRGKEKQRE